MTTLEVVNPFDGSAVGTVPLSNGPDAEEMLQTAENLYKDRGGWLPAYRRIEILERASEIMKSRFEELALLIAQEGGKPLMDARVEVSRAVDGVKLCAKELLYLRGEQIPMDLTAAGSGRTGRTHWQLPTAGPDAEGGAII